MKKILLIGIVGLLSCAIDVNATPTEVANVAQVELYASASPKVIKRGDRVIIIYSDGTTIVVDKDGSTTVVK